MKTVYLRRNESSMLGTQGWLSMDNMPICQTLELPFRQNKQSCSCIPTGTYNVVWLFSHLCGYAYYVSNVPGRFGILMHSGNYAGAIDIGLLSDTRGCILFADNVKNNGKQLQAINSHIARTRFELLLNKETFLLVIT
jgi:hypothetical protein